MSSWSAIAAANNAHWCDAVCRTHGIESRLDADAWTSRTRTPPLYPDAVTLVPDLSVPELLDRVDTSSGCSIKDSFATLDLTEYGFQVLFDAQWIVREPSGPVAPAPDPVWAVVRDAGEFSSWEHAWRGSGGPRDVLSDDLLHSDALTVLAATVGDRTVSGAVLNRDGSVVGISNFFAENADELDRARGCLSLATALFPEATLVGYESGSALDVVRAVGFRSVGPLRVWIRGEDRDDSPTT